MTYTQHYLDLLKARAGGVSDYRAAKILGLKQQTISHWRTGKDSCSPINAERIARALSIDPAQVIIAAQVDRAKTQEEKEIWTRLLRQVGGPVFLALIAFAAILPPMPPGFF